MKKLHQILLTASVICLLLTGCGPDPKLAAFENDMNAFCDSAARLNASINDLAGTLENGNLSFAREQLLFYLDELDGEFQKLAQIEFPEKYAYLEELSAEAGQYMSEAVSSYHALYGSEDSFTEAMAQYAEENYARANRRLQIILSVIHGEDPAEYEEGSQTISTPQTSSRRFFTTKFTATIPTAANRYQL